LFHWENACQKVYGKRMAGVWQAYGKWVAGGWQFAGFGPDQPEHAKAELAFSPRQTDLEEHLDSSGLWIWP